MRVGGFPGQQEALLQLMAERQRLSRRKLLSVAGGAFAVGLGGGVALRTTAEEATVHAAPAAASTWAARLAHGPLDALIAHHGTFLREVAGAPTPADVHWTGVARLAAAALDPRPRTQLGRNIVMILEPAALPA